MEFVHSKMSTFSTRLEQIGDVLFYGFMSLISLALVNLLYFLQSIETIPTPIYWMFMLLNIGLVGMIISTGFKCINRIIKLFTSNQGQDKSCQV